MRFITNSLIGASFVLLFIFLSGAPNVGAEEGNVYQVGTSNLNVRTAPNEDAEVVGKLNKGDQVVAFNEKHGWAQTYYNGKEVWVATQFLNGNVSSDEAATSAESSATVTASDVQVRTGPGTKYRVSRSVNNGETYDILQTEGDWVKIDLGSGDTGWISSSLTNQGNSNSTNQEEKQEANVEEVSSEQPANREQGNLANQNIIIDPGHGGEDPGTTGLNGEFEKDITLTTANKVANRLREAGATVMVTRSDDRYISLGNRVAFSNAYQTDAFISLHYDGYESELINGFSTHYYTENGDDRKLAQSVQNGLAEHVNMNNRGVMNSNYFVLRENRDLSVLVELGFLSSPNDLSTVQTEEHQQQVSEGITNGLINYFN